MCERRKFKPQNVHTRTKATVPTQTATARCCSRQGYVVIYLMVIIVQLVVLQQQSLPVHAAVSAAKGLPMRMRSAKIANIHGLQAAAESIGGQVKKSTAPATAPRDTTITKPAAAAGAGTAAKTIAGKYEIRSVAGEPNYKSVNLTWEVEFVPGPTTDVAGGGTTADGAGSHHRNSNDDNNDVVGTVVTNSSAEVEPPKAFQIFFCELQSFGPHRCRSKLVDDNNQDVEPSVTNNAAAAAVAANDDGDDDRVDVEAGPEQRTVNRRVRHYTAQIDNLRMATKYSFHIRPQPQRRRPITGRSELFDNDVLNNVVQGEQTIVIPTKGFSAQATQCLPHASEIEVETGPYFGGKIVVDGGNCGIKGNPNDPVDKYMMRIDHKMCGSMVKPETNTVETFITVQENLGIFTHSTRRFVVVCSFQSGMQTVRASFTVPGKGGVAAAVENDPFEPDQDRVSREQRQMRYVDKSALILREPSDDEGSQADGKSSETSESAEVSDAFVTEVQDPATKTTAQIRADRENDTEKAIATLEDIIPGVNEQHIKHENEVYEKSDAGGDRAMERDPARQGRLAKYAKLVASDQQSVPDDRDEWFLSNNGQGRAMGSTLQYISANAGSVVITIALSVVILIVCLYVIYREASQRRRQQCFVRATSSSRGGSVPPPHKRMQQTTLPRSLQQSQPCSM